MQYNMVNTNRAKKVLQKYLRYTIIKIRCATDYTDGISAVCKRGGRAFRERNKKGVVFL